DPAMIDTLVAETPLIAASDTRRVVRDEPSEDIRAIEAVVQPGSVLIGRSARRLDMQQRYGVNLLAVSREGERITERLRDIALRP
ncbi:hypothetical protein ABTM81_20135, partial [Acinetobacter baumannii]